MAGTVPHTALYSLLKVHSIMYATPITMYVNAMFHKEQG